MNIGVSDQNRRGPVGPKPICHDQVRTTISFHRVLEEIKCSPEILAFSGEDLEHLTFLINRTLEIVCDTVDPNEGLVHVPAPL